MSQEKVLKTLESLGLAQLDARVYVFLAKRGPQKAKDVAKSLKMPKQTLYVVIKNLQKKGLVIYTLEHPARFSVVPFEKVLDLFVKAKMEEAQRIQQSRDEILSDWRSIVIAESDETSAKFTVIEGRSTVYSKIQQMIQETKKQLSFVTTVPSLVRADQYGLFDAAFSHPLRPKIQFRFITDLSDQNVNAMKALLKKKPTANFSFEGRTPDLDLRLLPRMIIRDEKETMFFIDPKTDTSATEEDYVCLWTNCKTLVDSFSAMFEDLWSNSTDIEKKIAEVETGKPTPKTCVIAEAKTAKKKYDEALRSAREEIVIMTSSKGLLALGKSMPLLKELIGRGVSVRIMASIVNENLEAAQQLMKHCEVRHVPAVYLGATTVDGQHFFQFKNSTSKQADVESLDYFENTFYTNDAEYVRRTENMLNDIWKNASIPSAITLESVITPKPKDDSLSDRTIPGTIKKISGPILIGDKKPSAELTEKDILNKIINAQKHPTPTSSKGIVRQYGSTGQAIIRPPEHFNLPDTLIHILHFEKHSTYGAEDAIIVMLWLETPKGYAFVPTAFVGDNPEAMHFWKKLFAGIPFEQNIQLVRKDELQTRIHGNTLFAGWTVQIPLLHPPYNLPPSALLLEGYGNVKTSTYSIDHPSGYRVTHEYNGFEAFVTFLHPLSKYAGPGTDGFFGRDCVSTVYPP